MTSIFSYQIPSVTTGESSRLNQLQHLRQPQQRDRPNQSQHPKQNQFPDFSWQIKMADMRDVLIFMVMFVMNKSITRGKSVDDILPWLPMVMFVMIKSIRRGKSLDNMFPWLPDLNSKTQVSSRLSISGNRSPGHSQNPLSGERRKTLSITHHALSPPPSHHHLYIIHQLTTKFLSYYNVT